MATKDDIVDQVKAQVSDFRVRLAMLTGAGLEGGWGPHFNVGDQGTSFGPFQMHWGGALGPTPSTSAGRALSQRAAEDPAWAVAHMKGSYAGAVKQVPDSLWRSNPEAAAETAARLAERPAQDYFASQGQKAVDAAYGRAKNALSGKGGGVLGDIGSLAGDIPNPITAGVDAGKAIGGVGGKVLGGVAGDVAKGAGAVLTPLFSSFKDFAVTMSFTGLGLGLIVLGGYQAAKPAINKVTQTAEKVGPAVAAAAA